MSYKVLNPLRVPGNIVFARRQHRTV